MLKDGQGCGKMMINHGLIFFILHSYIKEIQPYHQLY